MKHTPILALAPNGAHKQKSDHPALPLSLEELVQTAVAAQLAGASLLHLHIRDDEHGHTLDADRYRHTIDAISEQTEDKLIIQITSESAGIFSPAQQIASVQATNPDCVSIALRELVPEREALPAAQALFHWCAEQRCRAQFIIYSEGDLQAYLAYREQDIIPDAPHSLMFVLGRYKDGQTSSKKDLAPYLNYRDEIEVPWMVCAFGANEQECLLEAAHQGGHMRTGFENNLLKPDGIPARNNIEQLSALAENTKRLKLRPATAREARRILSIRPSV